MRCAHREHFSLFLSYPAIRCFVGSTRRVAPSRVCLRAANVPPAMRNPKWTHRNENKSNGNGAVARLQRGAVDDAVGALVSKYARRSDAARFAYVIDESCSRTRWRLLLLLSKFQLPVNRRPNNFVAFSFVSFVCARFTWTVFTVHFTKNYFM